MSLAQHGYATARLAAPIIVARAALVIMFTVDTIMVGRLGATPLAHFGLGVAPQLTLMLIAVGALQATAVLVSQAVGAGDMTRIGTVFRASVVHAIGLAVIIFALSLSAGSFFRAIGHDPNLAEGAGRVSIAFGIGMPGTLLFIICNLFMEATGRPKTGMVVMLIANVVNVPLNLLLGFGWGGVFPALGAEGIMLASSIARTAAGIGIALLLILSALRLDNFQILKVDKSLGAFFSLLASPPARRLRRLGLPMGLAQGIESAAFSAVVMMAGLIGTVELAAYQATMTLVTLIFMMAIGTAGATAIRVGQAIGAAEPRVAGRAGWVGIALGAIWPIPAAIAFFTMPEAVARLVVEDPAAVMAARQALFVAGFLLCFDAAMGVALGALRGLGDVWWPTAWQIAAFWLMGIPIAWGVGMAAELGAGGLIFGLFAGVLVSLAGLLYRFRRRIAALRAEHERGSEPDVPSVLAS